MTVKERAEKLEKVLQDTLNYLYWNADNLSGDDLVGDGRLTKRYKEVVTTIEETIASDTPPGACL